MSGLAVPGLDPAGVNTLGELAACLDGLRRRRGLSYEAMTVTAERLRSEPRGLRREPLARSTIGEIVTGRRLPSRGKLPTFLAVCGIAAPDLPQWLKAWERAATAGLPQPSGGVRVRDADPHQLGVHAAIRAEDEAHELPVYVPRDVDVSLRAALDAGSRRGSFVLLVGARRSVRRTLYEALLGVLPRPRGHRPGCQCQSEGQRTCDCQFRSRSERSLASALVSEKRNTTAKHAAPITTQLIRSRLDRTNARTAGATA